MSEIIIATAITLFAGGLGIWFSRFRTILIPIILPFTGGYIFTVCLNHFFPELYIDFNTSTPLLIILGFLIQLILDQFSKGIEHGHFHVPNTLSNGFILSLMIGLGVHAFIEGVALGDHTHIHSAGEHVHEHSFLWAILIHKAPAAFALGCLGSVGKGSIKTAVIVTILFALMTPFGMLVPELFGKAEWITAMYPITVGSLLHISSTMLFESGKKLHAIDYKKLLAMIIGISIALLG